VTLPEVRRLLLAATETAARCAVRLRWSYWRRTHQAVAQCCHRRRRAHQHPPPEPLSVEPPIISLPGTAELTEACWRDLAPLLPQRKPRAGCLTRDYRRTLEGILWVAQMGAPWRTWPPEFGPWQTIFGRYRQWCNIGLWPRLMRALHQAVRPG
jgi:Putative transposase of IS4/5 family (DUF4096)